MKSMNYIKKIQPLIEVAFKSQDPELFDIVFDIDGKKLYADKLILSINSSTFKSMLSDRWISKNNIISIRDYSFNDFKELLTFIYSGKCNITKENIFKILAMSEFYQIEDLRELCDVFLSGIELNLTNYFQLPVTSNKYSIIQTKKPIHDFVTQNFLSFMKSDGFLNADKSKIKGILAMQSNFSKYHEDLFQCIYEWSENQAIKKLDRLSDVSFNIFDVFYNIYKLTETYEWSENEAIKKQKELNVKNLNMKDAIKTEMQEFLPYIQFKKMKFNFLLDYVVPRGFIFTYVELADILKNPNNDSRVKITNSNGQAIYGDLSRKRDIQILKSINGQESDNEFNFYIYWDTNCKKPSTPSPLMKRDGVH
uniref:BTB domain-containing protein n=1 Tax=Panagrolaimus sp. PS1159 TaxID=55785 RepID=A0AC35GKT7_9BILA